MEQQNSRIRWKQQEPTGKQQNNRTIEQQKTIELYREQKEPIGKQRNPSKKQKEPTEKQQKAT